MSRVFVSGATGATVYVFSNDHCPPHVSARHRGEEWIARVQFSYLNAEVELWSIEPIRNAPTQRAINGLLQDVSAQLRACRRSWWGMQRTTCLDNQWVLPSAKSFLEPLLERVPEAKQIDVASYDIETEQLWVQFCDGTSSEARIAT
jgi:hypothetical protein